MLSPVQVDVWWNYSLLNQFVFTSNQQGLTFDINISVGSAIV